MYVHALALSRAMHYSSLKKSLGQPATIRVLGCLPNRHPQEEKHF